jgi:TolB-like protein
MSFYHELKRRNVFRVGLAYGITSWIIAQIAGLAATSFFAPDWVMKMTITMLILGLPVAMVMAWAYELTPEGLRRESDVEAGQSTAQVTAGKLDRTITIALVVAVAYFTYDKFVLDPKRDAALLESATRQIEEVASEAAMVEGEQVKQQSIAVLPFVNMSEDPGNEYFADGLSEEILNLLAKISDLKVIGRTSSFAFKGKEEDLRDIGRTLGVKTILEGSVRKSGERVRITAQLIDVADGSHLWSETYDRTMTEIFAVQDDVAAAIIDALQLHVGSVPSRGRPTENSEAYTLFLKAKSLLGVHDGIGASPLLKQATTLDPNFAEAHELLAFSYWTRAGTDLPVPEANALYREAAAAALAIDPDLHFAQALYVLPDGGSGPRLMALKELERAWRENPFNSAPLRVLIYELHLAGYHQEAHRYAEQWVSREPITPMANYSLGETLFSMGRIEEAWPSLTFAYDQGEEFALWNVPAMNLIMGNDELAIAQLESLWEAQGITDAAWVRDLVEGARDPHRGQAYVDRRIEEVLASIPDEQNIFWTGILEWLYLQLGFLDRFYETIFAHRPSNQGQTMADINFWGGMVLGQRRFTAHPKFLEVAGLLGIPDIWEQRGPPDFCEKASGQWVCQ